MAIKSLRPALTVSGISRVIDVPRSSIYYRRIGKSAMRNPESQRTLKLR